MELIKQIKIKQLQKDILNLYEKCEEYQDANILQEQIKHAVEIILKGDFFQGDYILSHICDTLDNYPKR